MALVFLAFICGLAMDYIWAACINAVTGRRPFMAANLSAVLYLCTIVSTVLIVEKCFVAVAAYIVGGWIGTYFAARKP